MKRHIVLLLSCVTILSSCGSSDNPAPQSTVYDTLYLSNTKYYMSAISSGTQLICEVSVKGGSYQSLSDFVVKAKVQKLANIYEADSARSYIGDGPVSIFNNLPNWADTSTTVIATVKINSTYYNLRDKKLNK
jgi:hypothetical protein